MEESGERVIIPAFITVDSTNKPDNGKSPEPALIGGLARVIAFFVRMGRGARELLRRLTGRKKRGRYAPLVDMPSAAEALTPRVLKPATGQPAKSTPEESIRPVTPFLSPFLGEEESPMTVEATETGRRAMPLKKTRDFQAVESGETTDHEMIARIQARKAGTLAARRRHAFCWIRRRKFARLHRRFPLWQVATFYLCCAAMLSLLASLPFLSKPRTVTVKSQQSVPKIEDPMHLFEDTAQLISLQKYDAAERQLQLLRPLWPNDPRIHHLEGAMLAGRKDYVGARKAFEKALALQPQARSVHFNLAELDFVSGNYAAAEAGYKKLTTSMPKNGMILFRLYLCARLQNKTEEAAEFEASPALAPQSVEWLYVQAAKNFLDKKKSAAWPYVTKARILYPDESKVFDLTLERIGLLK